MSTKIEWTDETWNPVVGCSKVTEGCRYCYAMKQAHRNAAMAQQQYIGLTEKRASGVEWTGLVRTVPSMLEKPLGWKKPRMIFVNSMSDLFHPDVPFDFIDQVFAVMALCKRHTFQILTKRPQRMLEYMRSVEERGDSWRSVIYNPSPVNVTGLELPLANVWLGVSVENQLTADARIPILLQTPAAVRWLSMEPLLGDVDIEAFLVDFPEDGDGAPYLGGIDWVVVGGESGHHDRPMDPIWARSLRDQCAAAGVPFLFKQWGDGKEWGMALEGSRWLEAGWSVKEKKGGRTLDGVVHNEYPVVEPCR